MKIVMVGALRFSNFGDILFSNLFYKELLKHHRKDDILIYESPVNKVSDSCRNELDYQGHCTLKDVLNADKLLYISGGYFSNTHSSRIDRILWYIRYALPGTIFAKRGKDIYILGIGGGDYVDKHSAKAVKKILSGAKKITVRNVETQQKLSALGTSTPIELTSDTAQVISRLPLLPMPEQTKALFTSSENKKIVFLHMMPIHAYSELIQEKVFPALRRFLVEHPEYELMVGFDCAVPEQYLAELDAAVGYFSGRDVRKHRYSTTSEFCSLLAECSLIVTPKLHVGIVSASLGKSVVSFPIHYEKTGRYYRNIGCPERCRDINQLDPDTAYEMLCSYHAEPLKLSEEILDEAQKNLSYVKLI